VLKADRGFNVQILEGLHKRREHRVESSDEAIALAGIWEASRRSAVPVRPASIGASIAASGASTGDTGRSDRPAAPPARTRSPQQMERGRAARTNVPGTVQSVPVRRYPLGVARGFMF
jgi:hypothetical protein